MPSGLSQSSKEPDTSGELVGCGLASGAPGLGATCHPVFSNPKIQVVFKRKISRGLKGFQKIVVKLDIHQFSLICT